MKRNVVLVYSQDDHDIFGLGYYWQDQDCWTVTQSFKTKAEAIHAKKEGLLKWETIEDEDNPQDPEPITDLPDAVDFKFLRNEKKNRITG